MNKKFILAIVISSLLIIGGYFFVKWTNQVLVSEEQSNLVAYNATSTANFDTSNWKTYYNEKYSFEFKYPSDFILDDEPTPPNSFQLLLIGLTPVGEEYGYVSFDLQVSEPYGSDKDEKPNTLVGDIPAFKYYHPVFAKPAEQVSADSLHTTWLHKDLQYYFSLYFQGEGESNIPLDSESVYYKILSTFKFVK